MAGFNLSYNNQQFANPFFTKDEFSKFEGLDMNLISKNAQYANEVGNKRLDSLMKERADFIEKTKLNKRFSDLEQGYLNSLNSVIDNASKVQLSDNANFVSLNTEITKLKNDPVLKSALYTSEQAKKYQEYREKNPDVINQPWNNPNEKEFKKFVNAETNEFDFQPIFQEVDYDKYVDEYIKGGKFTESELTALKAYGKHGLVQNKISGIDQDALLAKLKPLEEFMKKDPAIASYFNRRYTHDGTTADSLLDTAFRKGAAKHAVVKNETSMPDLSTDFKANIQNQGVSQGWAQINLAKEKANREFMMQDALLMKDDPERFKKTYGYDINTVQKLVTDMAAAKTATTSNTSTNKNKFVITRGANGVIIDKTGDVGDRSNYLKMSLQNKYPEMSRATKVDINGVGADGSLEISYNDPTVTSGGIRTVKITKEEASSMLPDISYDAGSSAVTPKTVL